MRYGCAVLHEGKTGTSACWRRGNVRRWRDAAVSPTCSASRRTGDEERAIIAVLHDVIEDSDVTAEDLRREGFSEPIVDAIKALTRPEGEASQDFIFRAAANELARPVKIADLRDNLNRTRLAVLPAGKRDNLLAKYDGALSLLDR